MVFANSRSIAGVSLADSPAGAESLQLTAGGRLDYWSTCFAREDADRLERTLGATCSFSQHRVQIAGRSLPCPRLSAWHGDPGAHYAYSGHTYEPAPWTAALDEVRDRIEACSGHRFNAVLVNYYRNGADSMGWHCDDEPELGPDPVIASVTFGEARRFLLRPKRAQPGERRASMALALGHGSLLTMDGTVQRHYQHALPKTQRPVGERLNLTFRLIGASRQP